MGAVCTCCSSKKGEEERRQRSDNTDKPLVVGSSGSTPRTVRLGGSTADGKGEGASACAAGTPANPNSSRSGYGSTESSSPARPADSSPLQAHRQVKVAYKAGSQNKGHSEGYSPLENSRSSRVGSQSDRSSAVNRRSEVKRLYCEEQIPSDEEDEPSQPEIQNEGSKIAADEPDPSDSSSDMSELSDAPQKGDIESPPPAKAIDFDAFPAHVSEASEAIVVSHAGQSEVNGEYRWFAPYQRWCLFNSDGGSFCLARQASVFEVYEQLKRGGKEGWSEFRWGSNVAFAYVIADIELRTIFYAAPQTTDGLIPNHEWISVNGRMQCPMLSVGQHGSEFEASAVGGSDEIRSSHMSGKHSSSLSSSSALAGLVIPEGDESTDEDLSDLD